MNDRGNDNRRMKRQSADDAFGSSALRLGASFGPKGVDA